MLAIFVQNMGFHYHTTNTPEYLLFILNKMRFIKLSLPILLFASFLSCQKTTSPEEYNAKASDPKLFHETTTQLTDVIIHDIFKPPVAARIYSYSFLAATKH